MSKVRNIKKKKRMNIDNPKLIKQLESLVDNRQDWLFRFAYIRIGQREDAEDIVQEVLLAAFKKLKEGQQVEELDRYIIRSVSNACRDYLRKNRSATISTTISANSPISARWQAQKRMWKNRR